MTSDIIDAARRTRRRFAVVSAILSIVGLGILVVGLRSTGSPQSGDVSVRATGTAVAPSASLEGPTNTMSAELSWTMVAGVALPVSPTAGPRETGAGRARSFANDWNGAVLAAVHLIVRTTPQAGPAVFEPTLAEQVVGPDAEAMRQKVRWEYERLRDDAGLPYGQAVGQLRAELAGFRIESFSSAHEAVISVLTRTDDRAGAVRYAATTADLSWVNGDWALIAPSGGSWDSSVLVVTADRAAIYSPLRQGG